MPQTNSAIQVQPGEDGAAAERNRLINGQFLIWQRTTSFPAPPSGDNFLGIAADRWRWQVASNGGTLSGSGMTRQTFLPGQADVPNNPTYFMRWELIDIAFAGPPFPSVGGPTDNRASNLVQRIESVRTLSGKTATLSFWMRGDINGTIAMSLLQWPGSSGTIPVGVPASLLPTNFTVTAGTWTFHRVTLDIPTISGFVLGPNDDDGLYLRFHNLIDANIATQQGFPTPISYAGELDFANVQLEEGDIDVPEFEHRQIGLELSLCQRYYQKSYQQDVFPGAGTPVSTERPGEIYIDSDLNFSGAFSHSFATAMRASPTISLFSSAGVPNQAFDIIGQTVDLSVFGLGETGFSGGWSNQQPPSGDPLSYSYHYTVDAEF